MLFRSLGHPGLRTVFVRRHGRAGAPDGLDGPRRWFCLREGHLRTGRWTEPDDLLESLDPACGTAYDGPLALVCTHGVHDVCCAVKGRPVAEALAARWPEATWECSHLGGDRFAPNVLLLPDLACYAGMPADEAVRVVEAHLAGAPGTTWLRGLAGRHPAEQVAIASVIDRLGSVGVAALPSRVVDRRGDLDAGTWTVNVADRARVVVRSSRRPEAARLTCRATRETRALQWDVVSVETLV